LSSTCFEYLMFVIRKTVVHAAFYGMFMMYLFKQCSRMEDVLDAKVSRPHLDDIRCSKHVEDKKNRIKTLI
jgi:hypothetical protein